MSQAARLSRLLFGMLALFLVGVSVGAAVPGSLSRAQLEDGIIEGLARVPEFGFIREQAEALGVRVWLFGGTAAGYAQYVKWDLERRSGHRAFHDNRFDYDYTNIYRSTQDLDIVIDGDARQAEALEKALAARYPHFLGSKARWEVRSLRQARGEKEPILDNPNFAHQHTDSNSTGAIELTRPPAGEGRVRDVMDWSSHEPHFLTDVREGRLHYYHSPFHGSTARFQAGLNPPIFSAIRALTKAFQYELELRPEDRERIAAIIRDFEPTRDLANPAARDWVERNGKKLFQNAVNLDFARRTLDELGLRQKLISIRNDARTENSLAWWMSREPLPMLPLGTTGRTARELGLDVVAHETRSFLAYESITRAHSGEPNVFISRDGYKGEAAAFGNGFYTRAGTHGAARTGITIRFRLRPDAREGIDFERASSDYVVIKNKAALEVIPESLDWTPLQFFEYLRSGQNFDESDKGLLEKLQRRVKARFTGLDPAERRELEASFHEEFARENPSIVFLEKTWPILGSTVSEEEIARFVGRPLMPPAAIILCEAMLSDAALAAKPGSARLMNAFVDALSAERTDRFRITVKNLGAEVLTRLLNQKGWADRPEAWGWINRTLGLMRGGADNHQDQIQSMRALLNFPGRQATPEGLAVLLANQDLGTGNAFVELFLKSPEWLKVPGIGEVYLRRMSSRGGKIYQDGEQMELFARLKPVVAREFAGQPDRMISILIESTRNRRDRMENWVLEGLLGLPELAQRPAVQDWLALELAKPPESNLQAVFKTEADILGRFPGLEARMTSSESALPIEQRQQALEKLRELYENRKKMKKSGWSILPLSAEEYGRRAQIAATVQAHAADARGDACGTRFGALTSSASSPLQEL